MSASDFNAQIIGEFRANSGSTPSLGDTPVLLLHHTGAKSGRELISPLSFIEDGDRHVLLASGGGRDVNPAWYWNLKAHPDAAIEIGTRTLQVAASEVDGTERERLTERLFEEIPVYEEYRAKTERVFPVIVLTRSGEAG